MSFNEHKCNIEIVKKKDNYYIKEDAFEHISPEQGIVILDKYTTTNKIEKVKTELDDAWSKIDDKIHQMGIIRGLLKKKKPEEEDKIEDYRG